jgi:hypothetical protein
LVETQEKRRKKKKGNGERKKIVISESRLVTWQTAPLSKITTIIPIPDQPKDDTLRSGLARPTAAPYSVPVSFVLVGMSMESSAAKYVLASGWETLDGLNGKDQVQVVSWHMRISISTDIPSVCDQITS